MTQSWGKSLPKQMDLTRKEQSTYLAILQDTGVNRPARKLVKVKKDRKVKDLVDKLNKNATTNK